MKAATSTDGAAGVAAPDVQPLDKRAVLAWEAGSFVFIMLAGSALHFLFELSDFSPFAAVFGSVNESTFEHLKLFFWPALAFALVQHAYVKGRVNNYWWGKGLAMLVTPLGVIASFYFYLGIALPLAGEGFLAADIGTGAFGVLAGNVVSYRVLTAPDKGNAWRNAGFALIVALGLAMATSAWLTPRMFLYENFAGYEYRGEFGILDDYTPYLVFPDR